MPTPAEPSFARRRLVLHVCTRADVEAELQASLDLAAAMDSELATCFVMDEASIAACTLPFPTMIDFAGGELDLSETQLDAALRREARQCRQIVAAAAERSSLSWSFETLRSRAPRRPPVDTRSTGDILVFRLDRLGLSLAELLAAARELAPRRGGVMLVPEHPARRQGGLVTIDRLPGPRDSLARFAASLAAAMGTRVSHSVVSDAPAAAQAAARIGGARLLLASLESPLLADVAALGRLLSTLRTPLLLVPDDPDDPA
jgi:hypothetical protein